MKAESVAKSIQMLKAVLDGKTYDAVARESRLSRSAVEQRVKALARDVQRIVGVEYVDEDEVPTLIGMRARKDSYLEALAHFQPQRALSARKKRRALTDEDIHHALTMTCRRGNCRKRDVALLLVLFATAAKPLEIARLEVADYLNEDGSVREESVLRAQAAVNGYARPLFFASRKVIAAIDAYLEERVRKGQGTKAGNGFRGLDAHSKLFLTHDGHAMPVRVRVVGDRQHHLCGVILDIYRKIFARAGLNGVSALCARRTVAARLTERGCDLDQVGAVLGIKDRNSVRNLVRKQRKPLNAVVRELV